MRLVLLTLATLVALIAAAPAGACAAADDPCLEDPLAAIVTGETWFEYTLDGVRDADERRSYGGGAQVWADYNRDGSRQAGEAMVEIERDGSYSLPVDTRRLDGGTQVQVRFAYPWSAGVDDQFTPRCVALSPGCVRTLDVTPRQRITGIDFPTVGGSTLRGRIWDDKNANGRREQGEDAVPFLNVFLDDNDNGVRDPGEVAGYRTLQFGDGTYSIPIPTRYQEAGGALPPVVLERRPGVDCTAPADCAVRGLRTRTSGVVDVDHGVARPVVIFLHGYGGSQIACPGKLLWFNTRPRPDLMNMRLGSDREGLSEGAGGTSCSRNAFVDGLVQSVAGQDIYGGASQHFKDIAWPGRAYDYVWDWRKSPEKAVAGLDALVEKARCGGTAPCSSYAVKKVQLVGHSMGGLVMRHYIDDAGQAAKVQRAVTVGTPYWGSPKPIFPLAAGVEVPFFSGMDLFLEGDGLMAASRSFPGHFALMPSLSYGRWLTVAGMNGGRPLDAEGVQGYLSAIGADPGLYVDGLSEHGRVLDHFDDHGVDYQVVVGGGLPTMGTIALEHGIQDRAVVSWTDGDGTVPYHSAAHDTPRERLHTVCGVPHVPLTTARATTLLIDEFLIRGEEMRLASARCDWEARELSFYDVELAPLGRASAAAAARKDARVLSGGRALSVADAERAGLVDVLRLGGGTTIVARAGSDVRVELPQGVTATVRDLTPKGASGERRFGPVAAGTSVALGGSGAVTKGGKALKPVARDKKAPVTRATVKRLGGGKLRLALKARDAGSKVAATYLVVAGERRAYRKPVVLSAKRLAKTTYGSVDIWGNAEKPRKAPR